MALPAAARAGGDSARGRPGSRGGDGLLGGLETQSRQRLGALRIEASLARAGQGGPSGGDSAALRKGLGPRRRGDCRLTHLAETGRLCRWAVNVIERDFRFSNLLSVVPKIDLR